MKPGLGQLYLPVVVTDKVIQEGKDLLLEVVVPGQRGFLVFVLQSQGVEFSAVSQLCSLQWGNGVTK